MSLDALAPDQRAVVQLVLQQDRSYDELAALVGISADAVRQRAQRGLDRLAPEDGLSAQERGELADYLLGQQSVSRREATRSLLARSAPARAWARAVAGELGAVARSPLPEIPAEGWAPAPAPPEVPIADTAAGGPGVAAPGASREPDAPRGREALETPTAPQRPVRARPRPRPDRPVRQRPSAAPAAQAPVGDRDAEAARPSGGPGSEPRSNRVGGALLIGGLAIILVAVVLVLVNRDGGEDGGTTRAGNTPTPTATGTSDFQPRGQLELRAPGGGDARGQMVLFAAQDGRVAFTIQGEEVPASRQGEAYAVWLTGGDRPRRLGYAPQVGRNGEFGTSGPREDDQQRFADWLTDARRVVVSRETTEDATQPGPVVLQGRIPRGARGG